MKPPVIPDAIAQSTCKVGSGSTTCSFLTFGPGGFACAKESSLKLYIQARRATGDMRAMGDNCAGISTLSPSVDKSPPV